MPELPEITVIARQMDRELPGLEIAGLEVRQPKCLNMDPSRMAARLVGTSFSRVTNRGKWIVAALDESDGASGSSLGINLGMGGAVRLMGPHAALPERLQILLSLETGSRVMVRFAWFGYFHLIGGPSGAGAAEGAEEPPAPHAVSGMGPSPLDLDLEAFRALLARSPASGVKALILDQKRLAGVGNVYAQDPLWLARIHPLRKVRSLSAAEVKGLYDGLRQVLEQSIARGGLKYETDFYGASGRYGSEDFAVAYLEGKPCPRCGMPVQKIRTGATASFICPECQRL